MSYLKYFFFIISAEFYCIVATDFDLKLYQLTTIDLTLSNGLLSFTIYLFFITNSYFYSVLFFESGIAFFLS